MCSSRNVRHGTPSGKRRVKSCARLKIHCANITQKRLKLFRRKVLSNFFFRKDKVRDIAVESLAGAIYLAAGELVEMERTRCDPRAKPHGKRPPGAQCWRRKQTIPKSANIIPACGMRGSRWRKDVSPSPFLT